LNLGEIYLEEKQMVELTQNTV